MSYKITFVTNEGTPISDVDVAENSTYKQLFNSVSTTREGHEFAGWYGAADCVFAFDPNGLIQRNQWMYARWTEIRNREHWYMNTLGRNDSAPSATFTNQNMHWMIPLSSALYYTLWDKTINAIKIKYAQPGTMYVEVYPADAAAQNATGISHLVRREIVVTEHQPDEEVVCMFDPIYVQNGQVVAVNLPNGVSVAPFKICNGGSTVSDGNILRFIGTNTNYTGGNPNIDIGFIDNSHIRVSYVTTPSQVTVTIGETQEIQAEISPEDAYDKTVSWSVIDGQSNISIQENGLSCVINGIQEGQSTIRVTTNDGDETSDTTVNVSRYHTYNVIFNSNGGSQVQNIQFRPDTPTFNLPRSSKTNFRFVGWFDNEDLIGDTVNQILGGTENDIVLYAKWVPESVYSHFNGKKVTFVGDSVTTYWEDFLTYQFYNCHYTQQVCQQYGITRNTTMYGQMLQAYGMELSVLNSSNYAGVCYASRSQLMGANYQHMINNIGYNGTPDVIFLFLGVNDLYGITESEIREFDPTAEYVVGELDRTTVFSDSSDYTIGYVTMVRRIMDMYPSSELICMTTYCGSNETANASVRKAARVVQDICQHYGLMHVDFSQSDMHIGTYDGKLYTIDGIVHPANYGFKVLADYATQSLAQQLASSGKYIHLTKDGSKIRVDSAIRDGSGRKIETKYVRTVNGVVPENGNVDVAVPTNVSDLVNDAGYITIDDVDLSEYSKVFVTDSSAGLDHAKSDINIIKCTPSEYQSYVASHTQQEIATTMFDITSENEDVMNKRIVNVGTPTDATDAATKGYVDNAIPQHTSDLDNDAGFITANLLNGFVEKTAVVPALNTGTLVATIAGREIYAPEGGGSGSGGGGVALAPCVVMLHDSSYSTSITVGGITIVGSGTGGYFSINSSETTRMYGCLIVYVPTDDTYANTIQHVHSGSCLKHDTLITMTDGSTKLIKDIKVGDKVLCVNPQTNELDEDEVIIAETSEDRIAPDCDVWTFSDGSTLTTVNRHRFYNVQLNEFMYLEAWKNGEQAITKEFGKIGLVKHEHLDEPTWHCTLFTKRFNNYFANGLLSGNRHSIDFGKAL